MCAARARLTQPDGLIPDRRDAPGWHTDKHPATRAGGGPLGDRRPGGPADGPAGMVRLVRRQLSAVREGAVAHGRPAWPPLRDPLRLPGGTANALVRNPVATGLRTSAFAVPPGRRSGSLNGGHAGRPCATAPSRTALSWRRTKRTIPAGPSAGPPGRRSPRGPPPARVAGCLSVCHPGASRRSGIRPSGCVRRARAAHTRRRSRPRRPARGRGPGPRARGRPRRAAPRRLHRRGRLPLTSAYGAAEGGAELERGNPLPASACFETLCTAFAAVRSVKFCARTAHDRVTEKYDGRAAHTACGRFWEAA